MNKAWKAKWLKALTSGEYKQTRGKLRSARDGYCCLGVLCDVVAPKRWERTYVYSALGNYWTDWTHNGEDANLPAEICNRVSIYGDNALNTLVRLNDNSKANFTKIAAWIKKNL